MALTNICAVRWQLTPFRGGSVCTHLNTDLYYKVLFFKAILRMPLQSNHCRNAGLVSFNVQCVQQSKNCDLLLDCEDGSDEADCGNVYLLGISGKILSVNSASCHVECVGMGLVSTIASIQTIRKSHCTKWRYGGGFTEDDDGVLVTKVNVRCWELFTLYRQIFVSHQTRSSAMMGPVSHGKLGATMLDRIMKMNPTVLSGDSVYAKVRQRCSV